MVQTKAQEAGERMFAGRTDTYEKRKINVMDRIEFEVGGGLEIPLPKMVPVRQRFESQRVENVAGAVREGFQSPNFATRIKPGMKVAIGAGSRGIANIADAVRSTVEAVKALGGEPFIFPAMGSHGSATAEGQRGVLEGYGITEEFTGAPLRATMETVVIGELPDGTPIHVDKFAHEADGVILVNRVKPHTNFRGEVESGILKMLTIGMAKIEGATILHTFGFDTFHALIPRVAEFILNKMNILGGVALVENGYDQTAIVEVIPGDQLFEREVLLQQQAKRLMARLWFDEFDVLIIDEMGKDISGAGFDPNVTGRQNRGLPWEARPTLQKIVVLDLTEATHGNACGLGLADVVTRRLFEKMDMASTYANIVTSTCLDGGAIPIIMNSSRDAVLLAVKTTLRRKPQDCRIVRIKNTLMLENILVSEPLLSQVEEHPNLETIGAPELLTFADDV